MRAGVLGSKVCIPVAEPPAWPRLPPAGWQAEAPARDDAGGVPASLWSLGLAPAARTTSRGARCNTEHSHRPHPGSHFPKRHFWGVRDRSHTVHSLGIPETVGLFSACLKKNKNKNTEKPKKQPSSVVEEDSCTFTYTKRVTTNSFRYAMRPNVFPPRLA